jgi:diguanylate cyclase (GGDEF)-like protein
VTPERERIGSTLLAWMDLIYPDEPPASVTAHWTMQHRVLIATAFACVAGVVTADCLVSSLVLPALLVLAPFLASLQPSRRSTGLVALAAALAAFLLGIPDHNLATAQHAVDTGLVVLTGGLAISISSFRGRFDRLLSSAQQRAARDPLTGTFSRRELIERAEHLERIRQPDRPQLSIVMIDIDRFKWVNDAHGHQVGDEVLTETARRIATTLREGDLLGRYGGEEFVAVLVGGSSDDAAGVAQRVVSALSATPVRTRGGDVPTTISAGVATMSGDETIDEVLQRADDALYRSKLDGRNKVTVAVAAGSPAF